MLKFYSKDTLKRYTSPRKGETKFGQAVTTVSNWDALAKTNQQYVLLGIAEDIGVRANYGNGGTSLAWEACLNALCTIQHTKHTNADSLIILGEILCEKQMQQALQLDSSDGHYVEKLGELVGQIDQIVAAVIQQIIALGKTPIIIGGGHNNSFGNIKGTAAALGNPINCINFDAHTDLRALEHRHSGNGFSYAIKEGFLNKYFIFGLHRNYTPNEIYTSMEKEHTIGFSFFEAISIHNSVAFQQAVAEAEQFCGKTPFGLEVDLDAVAYMGSSAMSPSGFSVEQCRQFTRHFSKNDQCKYIHLCEGNPKRELFQGQVGKTLAYLVSDVVSR